jgi:hypothetical protein
MGRERERRSKNSVWNGVYSAVLVESVFVIIPDWFESLAEISYDGNTQFIMVRPYNI